MNKRHWPWLTVPGAFLLLVLVIPVGPLSLSFQDGDGQSPEPTLESSPDETDPPPEPAFPPSVDWARVQSPHMAEDEPERPESPPMEPTDEPAQPPPSPAPPPPPSEPAPGPAGLTTYVVQRGDNLYRIALRFGVSLQALAAANNLANPNRIYVGQQLVIPGPVAVTEDPEPAGGPMTYTVRRGDSLYTIARRFGLSISTLTAANDIPNPNRLDVGQVLVIPGGLETIIPTPTAQATVAPEAAQSAGEVYTVRRGDKLYDIALRFDTTIAALAAANNIANPNRLLVGQQLVIVPRDYTPAEAQPAAPQESGTVTYTVRRGDKLYQIAMRFNTTVAALAAANNIADPNRLYVGQQLVIVTNAPAFEAPPVGTFIWPVTSRRIVKYYSAGHPGIDIVDAIGVPVVAAAAGTVEFAGWNVFGYGYLVVIDHGNGVRTLYAHNDQLLVVTGQVVEQGQQISLMGSTGRSDMPHIHLEIIFDHGRVNPCTLLPGGC
jgi:murein DD-endopeptidase MepM/ murein hydrolase activator NlpD